LSQHVLSQSVRGSRVPTLHNSHILNLSPGRAYHHASGKSVILLSLPASLSSLAALQHSLRLYMSTLQGEKLRLFRALHRRLTQDGRLWSGQGEKGDKVPDGFGKFFPKSGQSSSSGQQQKGQQPPNSSSKPQEPSGKPKEIEFRFSFGKGGGGGGGGSGGPGKGPFDASTWTMYGFIGTVALLGGLAFYSSR
jgi:hypothetical protein